MLFVAQPTPRPHPGCCCAAASLRAAARRQGAVGACAPQPALRWSLFCDAIHTPKPTPHTHPPHYHNVTLPFSLPHATHCTVCASCCARASPQRRPLCDRPTLSFAIKSALCPTVCSPPLPPRVHPIAYLPTPSPFPRVAAPRRPAACTTHTCPRSTCEQFSAPSSASHPCHFSLIMPLPPRVIIPRAPVALTPPAPLAAIRPCRWPSAGCPHRRRPPARGGRRPSREPLCCRAVSCVSPPTVTFLSCRVSIGCRGCGQGRALPRRTHWQRHNPAWTAPVWEPLH